MVFGIIIHWLNFLVHKSCSRLRIYWANNWTNQLGCGKITPKCFKLEERKKGFATLNDRPSERSGRPFRSVRTQGPTELRLINVLASSLGSWKVRVCNRLDLLCNTGWTVLSPLNWHRWSSYQRYILATNQKQEVIPQCLKKLCRFDLYGAPRRKVAFFPFYLVIYALKQSVHNIWWVKWNRGVKIKLGIPQL